LTPDVSATAAVATINRARAAYGAARLDARRRFLHKAELTLRGIDERDVVKGRWRESCSKPCRVAFVHLAGYAVLLDSNRSASISARVLHAASLNWPTPAIVPRKNVRIMTTMLSGLAPEGGSRRVM